MNKEQIKVIMSIARPVIINLYGRQSLKLSAYNIMDFKEYFTEDYSVIPTSIWIQVQSKRNSFKLKIYKGKVEYINIGVLTV